jgi:hypothetical protein
MIRSLSWVQPSNKPELLSELSCYQLPWRTVFCGVDAFLSFPDLLTIRINVTVERVTFLLSRIEVPGLDIDCDFSVSSVSPGK